MLYSPWHKSDKLWGFKIDEGEFAGTTISINDVQLPDNSSDLVMDFNYVTLPEGKTEKDMDCEAFNLVVSTILNDIILKNLTETKT